MHSLVQLATRDWVKLHGQIDMWQTASLRIMAAAFPSSVAKAVKGWPRHLAMDRSDNLTRAYQ
jgi:hypothetical protein